MKNKDVDFLMNMDATFRCILLYGNSRISKDKALMFPLLAFCHWLFQWGLYSLDMKRGWQALLDPLIQKQ